MVSNNLSSIEGISVFPVIALIIFFVLFVILLIRTLTMKKEELVKMKNIPLEQRVSKTNSEKKNEK